MARPRIVGGPHDGHRAVRVSLRSTEKIFENEGNTKIRFR